MASPPRAQRRWYQLRALCRARLAQALERRGGRRSGDAAERCRVRAVIQQTLNLALQNSLAASSRVKISSHLRYWQEFCRVAQVDPNSCFYDEGTTSAGVRLAEADLLAAFASFFVRYPRRQTPSNGAVYASQVVSSVRTMYAETIGRRPGNGDDSAQPARLRAALKGLAKMAPPKRASRLPVLQQHLRAVRSTL